MHNLILSGCNGYMGRVVTAVVKDDPAVSISAGIDIDSRQLDNYPVFASPDALSGDAGGCGAGGDDAGGCDAGAGVRLAFKADVILDFSSPSALKGLLALGMSRNIPLILCATGYSREQISDIDKASRQIPVFRSGNMSLGINLLADLIQRACAVLGEDFDIEIIERHHRRKVDAPSGTALMLADAATSALPYDPDYVFERQSARKPRDAHEIGISAVRGGTIIGIHDVLFAGHDEVIELRHTAASREVFAVGALRAVKFIVGKRPGMYSMKDVLAEL